MLKSFNFAGKELGQCSGPIFLALSFWCTDIATVAEVEDFLGGELQDLLGGEQPKFLFRLELKTTRCGACICFLAFHECPEIDLDASWSHPTS